MQETSNLTPLMKQYWDIKSLHSDKILLFRMGDFFEMFFDDAVKAAPLLGIALTSRNKKAQDETPMCGMPHHSIGGPINKLLSAGLKVAICDQIEDPKTAKGIVKRAVTRILTPGMVYDSDTLESSLAHYIACYDSEVLACVDTTTGEAFYFSPCEESTFQRLIEILPIAELILPESKELPYQGLISLHQGLVDENHQLLTAGAPYAARRLISYILSLGGGDQIQVIQKFEPREIHGRMDLSQVTIRHLEIFSNYKGEDQGTLFRAVNRTQTSAGARLLRSRLSFPLTAQSEIEKRLDHVQRWLGDVPNLKRIREILGQMGDIERRLGKITQSQCHGRDLLALAQSIHAGLSALKIAKSDFNQNYLLNLAQKIETTLVEEPPFQTRQGHMIRQGVHPQLDEYIVLTTDTQGLLQKMEEREKEATGISSLKIRYNNVFGYYIEITNTHKDKAPSHYMRKQTLANAERYCTDELVELEKKVLSAQTKRFDLEFEIFDQLRKEIIENASQCLQLAQIASELDVSTSLAWLSLERKYTRPLFTNGQLQLVNCRHPVVEQTVKKTFIPNSIELDKSGCLLLTGPNMAGKSTIMRQVALIAILAQTGAYVPAESAKLPIFDHLFTRIGASDQLSEGLSTFMVEMTETSEMIKKATSKSLLILDEVGRGTSTFDGMSLAQAILEHILTEIRCLTFFATHYHELTALHKNYPHLKNAHMSVGERNGEIHFLHTLKDGPAQKSYGIQVARLAGLPQKLTKRAEALLKNHEKQNLTDLNQLSLMDYVSENDSEPIIEAHPLIEKIKKYPAMNVTPLQALQQIAEWQKELN